MVLGLRSQRRYSAYTVWPGRAGSASPTQNSLFLSPTLRHTHSPLSVCPSALPASQHGASGAVQEDCNPHRIKSMPVRCRQRQQRTTLPSYLQHIGHPAWWSLLALWSPGLPTPIFLAATLPDSCLHRKTTLCDGEDVVWLGSSTWACSSLPCRLDPAILHWLSETCILRSSHRSSTQSRNEATREHWQ